MFKGWPQGPVEVLWGLGFIGFRSVGFGGGGGGGGVIRV